MVVSDNGGLTWRVAGYAPDAIASLSFVDSSDGWALTYGDSDKAPASIYRTTDGAMNWQKVGSVAEPGLTSLVFVDEHVGYARARNEVFRTDDGGRTWSPASWGATNDIAVASDGQVWRITNWRLYHSTDGTTWDEPSPALRARAVSARGDVVWVVPTVKALGVLRSDDRGRTWVRIDLGGVKLADVAARDVNSAIVRTADGALLVTSGGGSTWTTLPAP